VSTFPDLTRRQQAKVEQLARQYGCWPDDVYAVHGDSLVHVTIGVAKDRPKRFTLTGTARVLTRGEARAR
jgi:hypothetical protein